MSEFILNHKCSTDVRVVKCFGKILSDFEERVFRMSSLAGFVVFGDYSPVTPNHVISNLPIKASRLVITLIGYRQAVAPVQSPKSSGQAT